MDDQSVVGYHVAVAAVLVVAVVGCDLLAGSLPIVGLRGVPLSNLVNHAVDDGIGGDQGETAVDELVDVAFDKGLGLHSRHHLCAIDGLAVVTDAAGAAGEIGGELRVAGRYHGPAVDKDLGADLFGNHLAVQLDGTTLRCRIALFQAHIGGVFGGVAHAAPPEDGAPFDEVVEPGLPDLGSGQIAVCSRSLRGRGQR